MKNEREREREKMYSACNFWWKPFFYFLLISLLADVCASPSTNQKNAGHCLFEWAHHLDAAFLFQLKKRWTRRAMEKKKEWWIDWNSLSYVSSAGPRWKFEEFFVFYLFGFFFFFFLFCVCVCALKGHALWGLWRWLYTISLCVTEHIYIHTQLLAQFLLFSSRRRKREAITQCWQSSLFDIDHNRSLHLSPAALPSPSRLEFITVVLLPLA